MYMLHITLWHMLVAHFSILHILSPLDELYILVIVIATVATVASEFPKKFYSSNLCCCELHLDELTLTVGSSKTGQ